MSVIIILKMPSRQIRSHFVPDAPSRLERLAVVGELSTFISYQFIQMATMVARPAAPADRADRRRFRRWSAPRSGLSRLAISEEVGESGAWF